MQITISGRHLEITPAIRQYIEEKISKVKKISLPVIEVHVTISVEKYRHIVEIALKTNMSFVKVSGESEDMYASIDLTIDKLNNYVKRLKEKIKDHKQHEPKIDELAILTQEELEEDKENSSNFFINQLEINLVLFTIQ